MALVSLQEMDGGGNNADFPERKRERGRVEGAGLLYVERSFSRQQRRCGFFSQMPTESWTNARARLAAMIGLLLYPFCNSTRCLFSDSRKYTLWV